MNPDLIAGWRLDQDNEDWYLIEVVHRTGVSMIFGPGDRASVMETLRIRRGLYQEVYGLRNLGGVVGQPPDLRNMWPAGHS